MTSTGIRDVLGGIVLIAIGAFFAIYSIANYKLGSFAQMGPGMLPLLLGILLIGLGSVIAVIGYAQRAPIATPDWRSLGAVTIAIIAFAVLSQAFGMVPAVVAIVVGSALADNKLLWWQIAILTIVLVAIAVGVFSYGLGIRMPIFSWPF